MKPIRTSKVCIVLHGRFAGRKGVIMRTFDEGTQGRKFAHAIVAGIRKYPRRCTAKMSMKKRDRRSSIKVFMKRLNYNHIMPTRYTYDIDNFKASMKWDKFKKPSTRRHMKQVIRRDMEMRYKAGKNPWLFTRLPF